MFSLRSTCAEVEHAPDRLVWIALLVVDEAADAAEKDWISGSLDLRLALAYLCSIADGPTFALPSRRYTFDKFWETVTRPLNGNQHSAAYSRRSMVTCKQQMDRQLGFGPGIFDIVRGARDPEVKARQQLVEALLRSGEERDRQVAQARRLFRPALSRRREEAPRRPRRLTWRDAQPPIPYVTLRVDGPLLVGSGRSVAFACERVY